MFDKENMISLLLCTFTQIQLAMSQPVRVILQNKFKIFRIIFVLPVIDFLLCFKKEILTVEKILITILIISYSCS